MKRGALLALLLAGCVKRIEPAPRIYGILSAPSLRECTYANHVYRGDKLMCAELKKIILKEESEAQR